MNSEKRCRARYDAQEQLLAVDIPCGARFARYRFVRVNRPDINADVWHLGIASMADARGTVLFDLTTPGEWEMALHLAGRDDFSGGLAHGDEITTALGCEADGTPVDIGNMSQTPFERLCITQTSDVYDPADHVTRIAVHESEHIFTEAGLTIRQSVRWLVDAQLTPCYLAMFPVAKQISDRMETDALPGAVNIRLPYETDGVTDATLLGPDGLRLRMAITEYPSGYNKSGRFLMVDNGGNPYHKMYFFACSEGAVSAGETWRAETLYAVTQEA